MMKVGEMQEEREGEREFKEREACGEVCETQLFSPDACYRQSLLR